MIHHSIKNIIFDLGVVLLNLNFQASAEAFRHLNRSKSSGDIREFITNPQISAFETGSLTPKQFRDWLRGLLNNPLASDEELNNAWCALLGEVPQSKVELLRHLAAHANLFLYSNTNAIHIPVFRKDFARQHGIIWDTLFTKTFYSYEIYDRKPNISSYQKVFSMAGVQPSETLFVDDLEQNCSAAAKTGCRVLHYTAGEDLAYVLQEISE
jgi:glucose-1-phosphatase